MRPFTNLTRREFLQLAGISAGLGFTKPWRSWFYQAPVFPEADRLGRICVGKVDLRSRPSVDAPSVGVLYEDAIIVWLREVVSEAPLGRMSRRWVETPEGYVYAPSVQPVWNKPVEPVSQIPASGNEKGMWAEVCVPYADVVLANPPARSPWLQNATLPRLYYSQIMWIDDLRKTEDGRTLYQVNEKYGTLGDLFWADARGFRPLTAEEISPIHPEVEEKRIEVNVDTQTLSCYEGDTEVYFCQISSGGKWDAEGNVVDKWSTPVGPHPIWRKLVSIHMLGGTTGAGYDLPGIGWTSLFSGEGVAIHSTFWHNDFGSVRSHGCVNASPDDSKWVWRWSLPEVTYLPGDKTVQMPGGTIVKVIES